MNDSSGEKEAALKAARGKVEILIGDNRVHVGESTRFGLQGYGYRKVDLVGSTDELKDHLSRSSYDLLVLDMNLDGKTSMEIVREIRAGDVGKNPFVVIMATAWKRSDEIIREAIDAGVDDLLIQPLSSDRVIDRIGYQVRARKQFIVTTDYIGPDRRNDVQREQDTKDGFEAMDVPNTLRDKEQAGTGSEKKESAEESRAKVEKAKRDIIDERLRRLGFQMSFLVDLVLEAIREDQVDDDAKRHMVRLEAMALEARFRLSGSRFEGAEELCQSLSTVAQSIAANPHDPPRTDRKLLKPLSAAVLKTFYPTANEGELARRIATSIKKFKTKLEREDGA